jgi:EmrB/QacA subfamily drug resistance transporter
MQKPLIPNRWVLIICSFSAFVTPFMGSSVNVAVPVIGRSLSMNVLLFNWITLAYNLSSAVFLLPLGRLADLKGREIIFKFGLAVFAIFSLGCALAWSPYSLIGFRLLQGVGGAMIFGTSNAILSASFTQQERGKVLGIYNTVMALGMVLGPALGGVITQVFGWRALFGIVAAIALLNTGFGFTQLRNTPVESKAKMDYTGSFVYLVALTLLTLGFSSLPSHKGWWYMAVSVVGMIVFGIIELRSSSPSLDIRIYKGNLPFVFSNLATFLAFSASFAEVVILSLYLQNIKGMRPDQAGMVFMSQSVAMVLFSAYAGKLSDRISPGRVAAIGIGLLGVGLCAFIFLSPATPIWFIVACVAIIGLGFAFFISPNTNAVMSAVERKEYGVASGALATMRQVGQMVSMGIIMMLFNIILGATTRITRITPDSYGPFLRCSRIGFTVFTVLCVLGVFSSLARGSSKKSSGKRFSPDYAGFGLLIDPNGCNGCLACELACQQEHNYPAGQSGIQVVENVPHPTELCDLCGARARRGEWPRCVEQCPSHCISYGPLDELGKEMAGIPKVALFKPQKNTRG